MGDTSVVPLADVELKFSGAMAMLAAPVTVQLRALLEPEGIVAGFAANDEIAGAAAVPLPEEPLLPPPQPISAPQPISIDTQTPVRALRAWRYTMGLRDFKRQLSVTKRRS